MVIVLVTGGISSGREEGVVDSQTSVTIPAMMTCDLLVALMASRNSALSQALTSPWR